MTVDRKQLRQLWQEAFGDSAETLDAFFATGFSSNRCHYIAEKEEIISALYWFDCEIDQYKIAYLYAIATKKAHRGKGYGRRLLRQTHQILKNNGYAGAILVPASEDLFAYYESLGYTTATTITTFSCLWEDTPIPLWELDAGEYARLRKTTLPPGGVIQDAAALNFFQTFGKFYGGDGFLLAATIENQTLLAQEFLGDPALAPRILRALSLPQGRFQTPGADTPLAMFLPFAENCPCPDYFALALD